MFIFFFFNYNVVIFTYLISSSDPVDWKEPSLHVPQMVTGSVDAIGSLSARESNTHSASVSMLVVSMVARNT